MTVGQRIAQKRKETGLSQEALGERLGVSRQAIYKWESDAALPEIEKLITLSRIFSVSVGWLLGEEERESSPESGELTEEQLKMVEEIVARYLAARPEPEPPRKKRWPWVLGIAAAIVIIIVFINLFNRLDTVTQNYSYLQNSINNINGNVSSQIGSITNRVEEILHAQNELTAEWATEIRDIDIPANTVTFRVRVVPKTYRDGMTALFVARSGEETVETSVDIGPGNAFEGEITCPLTDSIDLTVIFVTEGQRETQLLDHWNYLLTETYPALDFNDMLWAEEKNGMLPAVAEPAEFVVMDWGEKDGDTSWRAGAVEVKIGLFKDRKLVMWYTEEMQRTVVNNETVDRLHYVRPVDVVLEKDGTYCEAMVVTDEYGRVYVRAGTGIDYGAAEGWVYVSSDWPTDPAEWEF